MATLVGQKASKETNHPWSIVAYRDTALLVVTTEVYCRASSLDIHAENEYLVSSMPKKNKTKYSDFFIGTVLSADGKKTKPKLEMGSKSMNLLCTSSIALDKSITVFVGPETGIIFDPKDTKLYLIKESVDKFKKLVKPADDRFPSIDSMRQVTSSFQSPTTYKRWRSTLSSFDDYIHKPATVFTLCDLPNNGGYGSNDGSFSRCASQFMQFLARAAITNSGVAERDDFNMMLANYELHKGSAKNWKALDSIIRLMEDKFESDANVNIYKFSNECNLSDIIPGISSSLTSANAKIKENIQARFEILYC